MHDGKQEGGQHVFHDLVHQLVLKFIGELRARCCIQEPAENLSATFCAAQLLLPERIRSDHPAALVLES